MRQRRALAAILAATACAAPTPPAGAPVPVDGAPADLRTLAGRWTGEFLNERTGQRGTISFELRAGRDTAHALVTVSGPLPIEGCEPSAETAFVLRLGRLGVSSGSIGGWLVPADRPGTGCVVEPWFEGRVEPDLLEGLYFSEPVEGASVRLGTWRVRRVP